MMGEETGIRAMSRWAWTCVLVVCLVGCHGHIRRDEHQLVRFRGPVRLILTAVLVAPGKDSGLPWDGPGSLPSDVAQGLRAPRPRGLVGSLFRALADGTGLGTLTRRLPWAANAFISGFAAPDVQVEMYLNGNLLQRSPMVSNSYNPTWTGIYTPPVEVHDFDQLEFRAIDRDVLFDDQIGVCTSQGMPWVNSLGYASAQTFQCLGQLWAIALRVVPVNPTDSEAPETKIAPEEKDASEQSGE